MTLRTMTLAALIEKGSNGDLLREMVGVVTGRVTEIGADGLPRPDPRSAAPPQ